MIVPTRLHDSRKSFDTLVVLPTALEKGDVICVNWQKHQNDDFEPMMYKLKYKKSKVNNDQMIFQLCSRISGVPYGGTIPFMASRELVVDGMMNYFVKVAL